MYQIIIKYNCMGLCIFISFKKFVELNFLGGLIMFLVVYNSMAIDWYLFLLHLNLIYEFCL